MTEKRKIDVDYYDLNPTMQRKARNETIAQHFASINSNQSVDEFLGQIISQYGISVNENENISDNIIENGEFFENAVENSEVVPEITQDIVPSLSSYHIPEETNELNEDVSNVPEDSEDSDEERDIDKGVLLASKIRQLVIDGHLNVTVTRILLRAINDCGFDFEVPRDYNELMDIPKKNETTNKYNWWGVHTHGNSVQFSGS